MAVFDFAPALRALTINLTELLASFATVPDQRKRRGVRYPLAVLLTIAVLAKLCGRSHVHALADWARARAPELAAAFGLQRRQMPHPATWARVLGFGGTTAAIEQALAPLLAPGPTEVPARASQHRTLDGKTLRGTIPAGASSGVHLLTLSDVTCSAAQHPRPVGIQANELTMAPQRIGTTSLTGALITGDAMFTHRGLSTQIVEAGGGYCWIVKANQPTLYDDLKLLFGPEPAALPGTSPVPDDCVTVRTVEKAHGRRDTRELTVRSLLCGYHPWPYPAQAFQVVRITHRGRRRTREVRYGIPSAPAHTLSATQSVQVVRGHWQIDNGLQYRRDVTVAEDAALVRRGHAPEVLATLNTVVCTLVAQAGLAN